MIFTNSRTIDKRVNRIQGLLPLRINNPRPIVVVQPKTYLDTKGEGPVIKKVKWGEPFWNLFHVLCEKIIDDDNFIQKKTQLLNIIFIICRNLPCPDCAMHATNYLNSSNFSNINTKTLLKKYFYDFHNSVNIRRGVPVFQYGELDKKYSRGVTINIIKEFMRHFENKHKSVHMLSNDFHRVGISTSLKEWFNTNIKYFAN